LRRHPRRLAAAGFRPEIEVGGVKTRVLAEQTAAVDPGRLGKSVGFLSFDELRRVDAALRVVLDL
jgi:mRNA interferase MazF